MEPLDRMPLKQHEVADFANACYLVNTVVPLAEGAFQNNYLITQSELNELLTGYSAEAEFVVAVTRVSPEYMKLRYSDE